MYEMAENDDDRPFAGVLREWLANNQNGLDQAKLARAIGVPQTYVNRWFRGVYSPQLRDLKAIEDAVGLRRGYFLERAGFVEPFEKVPGVLEAIQADDALSPAFKRTLIAAYEAAVAESVASRKTAR